jgi:hypothetical protein
MTKRDFFILLFRLFGLYSLVITLFSTIPQFWTYTSISMDGSLIVWLATALCVIFGLLILLIFYSPQIVSLLRLEKGFDDDKIDLGNLNALEVIKIGCFIIGGFLFIINIPVFLSHAYIAFQNEIAWNEKTSPDQFELYISGLNVVIGFLLIRNFDVVARILIWKNTIK